MKLITVATHSESYFPYLKKSCEKYNAHLDILGWGEKWDGYITKLKLVMNYIQDLPDDEIICFIDSFDVIMLRPLDELEKTFRSFNKLTGHNVIVGYDQSPSLFINQLTTIHFGTCHGILLNSGTYIGFVKYIKQMLKTISNHSSKDDQIALTEYVQKNPHNIHIDTSCIFFITINYPIGDFICDERIKIENKTLFYRGIKPFFAHGNGNTNMDKLIYKLGYKINIKIKREIQNNIISIQYKKVINNYLYFFVYLINIIFFVLFLYKNNY